MTITQRNAIDTPAVGLMIFNITDNCMQWFDGFFWFDACTGEMTPPPNPNLIVASPTYQGQSVIDTQGIGYNGETVPAASTITVLVTNTSANAQNYVLEAIDPYTGLQYNAIGTIAGSASDVPVILNNNEATIAWDFFGLIAMTLTGASNTLTLSPRIDIKSIPVSSWIEGIHFQTVINSFTGLEWMDRNLGAHRVATASFDQLSYGNSYQWGRAADGHEIVVYNGATQNAKGFNPTTATQSSSDTPGHGDFITSITSPIDWRSPQNNNLWQGVSGTNNPCPTGYRLPTETELNNERLSWVQAPISSTNDAAGAFASPLKFPMTGWRGNNAGGHNNVGTSGVYWSSTAASTLTRRLRFDSSTTAMNTVNRALSHSVRCIKD
jgi:uncharacterized protein (TIGR02145 family)